MKKFIELTKDEEEHAQDIYNKSIVLNCLDVNIFDDEYINIVRDSGLTATAMGVGRGFVSVGARHRLIERNPDVVVGPVTTVKEIRNAKKDGKVAAFFNAQNASMLVPTTQAVTLLPNFDLLLLYYKLGLRILMPTYNTRNIFADGCVESTDGGLSKWGFDLVEEMNKLNILYDSSHMGVQDTLDGCEYAKFPVCTHANARSVCDNVRNRTDEEIKAIAEKDGVLGLCTYPSFIKWTKMEEGIKPTIEDAMDHIDYIDKLVGVKHVGMGFDFNTGSAGPTERALRIRHPRDDDVLFTRPTLWGKPCPNGYWEYTEDLDNITKTHNVAKGMLARGYSDHEIKGVLGENWLRLFQKAWGE
jgi:membrane dipeptidase